MSSAWPHTPNLSRLQRTRHPPEILAWRPCEFIQKKAVVRRLQLRGAQHDAQHLEDEGERAVDVLDGAAAGRRARVLEHRLQVVQRARARQALRLLIAKLDQLLQVVAQRHEHRLQAQQQRLKQTRGHNTRRRAVRMLRPVVPVALAQMCTPACPPTHREHARPASPARRLFDSPHVWRRQALLRCLPARYEGAVQKQRI
eukprot:4660996-Pleurochrysis_carterae.AAC.8